jgi:hypothetical protein
VSILCGTPERVVVTCLRVLLREPEPLFIVFEELEPFPGLFNVLDFFIHLVIQPVEQRFSVVTLHWLPLYTIAMVIMMFQKPKTKTKTKTKNKNQKQKPKTKEKTREKKNKNKH